MVFPILEKTDDGYESVGTAFLLKSGLIVTAAHNFIKDYEFNFKTSYFFHNGECLEFGLPVYLDCQQEYKQGESIYRDLAVFRNKNLNQGLSDLEFSSGFTNNLIMYGFPAGIEELSKIDCEISNKDYSYRSYDWRGKHSLKFINCFSVNRPSKGGFSGGPIINGAKVYGMIVFGTELIGATAIKSEYIKEIVEKI